MHISTTGRKPKSFSWSYSKLKNFETCPKRSWHLDHAKDIKEEEGEHLQYGHTVHKVLAEAISGKTELPDHFKHLEDWVWKITAEVKNIPTTVLVEQQLAITKNYGPTEWFGSDAWYRGIADVIKIAGPVALVVDWKTGKILEDGVQLALMAACVFAHHPEIQMARTEFVWLKEGGATTRADFSRNDMAGVWAGVLPRVQTLESAVSGGNFPPRPSFLCRKWCPVEHCQHHGT